MMWYVIVLLATSIPLLVIAGVCFHIALIDKNMRPMILSALFCGCAAMVMGVMAGCEWKIIEMQRKARELGYEIGYRRPKAEPEGFFIEKIEEEKNEGEK